MGAPGSTIGVVTGKTEWEADTLFPMLGVQLAVLEPGEPNSLYHWETEAEAFLVISGEALLVVRARAAPAAVDFVHCPPKTKHVIVGAGNGPCVVIAMSSRQNQAFGPYGEYVADEVARKHGASPPQTARSSATRTCPGLPRSRRLIATAGFRLVKPSSRAFRELLAGSSETIAGTVCGTIIVMATLVAGAPAFREKLWNFLVVVVVTTLVFWAAHIYAHGLAESLQLRRRLTVAELGQIAHRERAIGLAVVLPRSPSCSARSERSRARRPCGLLSGSASRRSRSRECATRGWSA